ncbi:MAG: SDR family oxidoreductase [Gammaproteobacteria bacterium]|nr:SDR family oxidoreductase [Gammaproteobacteria bacterium]
MKDKSVVVTGAAQGIGEAIAKLAAERGARLALIDKNNQTLSPFVQNLMDDGVQAVGIIADLRARGACHQAFDEAVTALGNIDVLVNNAGIYIYTPIEEITDGEWDTVMDACLRGLFHTSVAASTHMRQHGGGRIVNIASVDGFIGFPEMAHYAAAKAGVISLTRTFAMAYVKDGILVNAVAPGLTDTPRVRTHGRAEEVTPRIPMGRLAEPHEIAEAACFLASGANTYCTGETMIVSGGLVIA